MPDTEDTFLVTSGSHHHRRRSSSFSSLSTFSTDSPLSPETILQTSVPFSWEKLPGIPKTEPQQILKNNVSKPTSLHLPPPPMARLNMFSHSHTNPSPRNKKITISKDPFLAAFIECCKDDQGLKNLKKSPTFQRFNLFSLYAICKTSCPVSESIVYMPKSNNLF